MGLGSPQHGPGARHGHNAPTHAECIEALFVCPECREPLHRDAGRALVCRVCHRPFQSKDGVYEFLTAHGEPDPRLKKYLRYLTPDETRTVVKTRQRAENGFLRQAASALVSAAIVLLLVWAVAPGGSQLRWNLLLLPTSLCVVDYVAFKWTRAGILRDYVRTPLTIETPEDWEVVNSLDGEFPSMADTRSREGRDRDSPGAAWRRRYEICAAIADRGGPGSVPRVLVDVGAGDGTLAQFITRECIYVPLDVMDDLLVSAKRRLPSAVPVKSSGHKTPFANRSVDVMVCTEALEHFPDPGAAIAEFDRILKARGFAVLTVPNAHRIRNPNILHILFDVLAGRAFPHLTQPVTLHPNMWVNALTHHYDFTVGMVKRMLRPTQFRLVKLSSFGFPWISGSWGRFPAIAALAERALASTPLLSLGGRDMLVVLEKPGP